MNSYDEVAQQCLESLRMAVREELERKRLLGQYAVFWIDGKVEKRSPIRLGNPIKWMDRNLTRNGRSLNPRFISRQARLKFALAQF